MVNGFLLPEQFEEGSYSIEYKSIFGKIERKTFKVLNDDKQKIILCLDKINHKHIKYLPIINRLKNDESYVIQNKYRGSFDHGVESIFIQKEHGAFYAKFIKFSERNLVSKLYNDTQRKIHYMKMEMYPRETVLKKNDEIYSVEMIKSKILSDNDIILIENFEKELSLLRGREDFCSWEDAFLISYKNTKIKIPGSRCYWRGWYSLVKKLGWIPYYFHHKE